MKSKKLKVLVATALNIAMITSFITPVMATEKNEEKKTGISVENNRGTEVPAQIIKEDTVWTKAEGPYILTGKIQIKNGVKLTLEPGVEVIGNGNEIINYGEFIAIGETEQIKLNNVNIIGQHIDSKVYTVTIENVKIDGGGLLSENGKSAYGKISIKNSIFMNLKNNVNLGSPAEDFEISGNIFSNCGGIYVSGNHIGYITNNVFYNIKPIYDYSVIESSGNMLHVNKNTFYNEEKVIALRYSGKIDGTNNYWRTVDEEEISKRIYDANDDAEIKNEVEFKPYLTKPDANTPAFSIPVIKGENKTIKVDDIVNPKEWVTASDELEGDLTSKVEIIKSNLNTAKAGEYEITYKVTNSLAASDTKTIKVTVNPRLSAINNVPEIIASDLTIKAGDSFNSLEKVTALDKEDGDLTSKIKVIQNEVNINEVGEYEVTYKVTDSKGASITKTIKVTVRSNEKPVITALDSVLKVGDDFDPMEAVTAFDNEDGDITSKIKIVENTVDTKAAGVYKVIYEVTDLDGNSTVKEIKVTVNPRLSLINSAPKVTANDLTIKAGDSFNPLENVTALDKEDGDLTSKIEVIKNEVNINEVGEYEVSYKVTDSKGASTTKTIKITVRSNEKPVITALDSVLKVGDNFDYMESVTALDKEDGDITSKIKIVENTVDTKVAGVYKVIYEVTDSDENKTIKEIKVTVNPRLSVINNAPEIMADDLTIKARESFNPLDHATAVDKEDGNLTSKIEVIKNEVNINEVGEYEVSYKVTDSKDASTIKTIKVTVRSNEKPVITAEDKVIKVGQEFDPMEKVTAFDNEEGDITSRIDIIENTVNINSAGVYKVVYEVIDLDGNSTVKEIKVTVNPRLSLINSVPKVTANDLTIKAGDSFNPLENVTALDREDGDLTSKIEVIKNEVNINEVGEYEVIYKVTDSKGASSTKTIKVTVRSNEKPVITAEDKVLKVGDNFDPIENVTALDNEDGDITSKVKIVENTVNKDVAGTYKVVYEVTDLDGNKTVKEIVVIVNPRLSVMNNIPEITATDLTIKAGDGFNPLENVRAIDKEDGDLTSKIEVIKNEVKENEVGEYEVTYKVTDSKGASSIKTVKVTVRSNEKPVITAEDKVLKVGDNFDPIENVRALDKEDGDITSEIKIVENTVNTNLVGTYKVVYEVTDLDGNKTVKERIVKVKIEFSDSSDFIGHWAEKEIKQAMEKGWVNIQENFRPNDNITRAEFVKIVNKAFGFKNRTVVENFEDVNSDNWYYPEVNIALNAGYISSTNKNFRPEDPISREEVASIITTIKKNKDSNLDKVEKLEDYNVISAWARSSVEGAIEAGYMGKNNTKFRPKDNITRAEAIVTLSRIK